MQGRLRNWPFFWLFFSPEGRIDLSTYWFCVLSFIIVLSLGAHVLSTGVAGLSTSFEVAARTVAYALAAWIWIAISAKRWRDMGKSGSWALLSLLLPPLGIVLQGVLSETLSRRHEEHAAPKFDPGYRLRFVLDQVAGDRWVGAGSIASGDQTSARSDDADSGVRP